MYLHSSIKKGKRKGYSAQVQMSPEIPCCYFANFQRIRGQTQEGLVSSSPLGCWSGNQRFPKALGQVTPYHSPLILRNYFLIPLPSPKHYPLFWAAEQTRLVKAWLRASALHRPLHSLRRLLISVRPLGPNPEQASSDLEALPLGTTRLGGRWLASAHCVQAA